MSHNFSFKEPTKIGFFVEDLRKNSVVHEEFMSALSRQAKNVGRFASTANLSSKALVADREVLNFFLECVKRGESVSSDKVVLVPWEIDEKTAVETHVAITNCLGRIHANAKGIQYALEVLNEEVKFHERMILNEVELLKEEWEAEVSRLKSEVEKKIKKLKSEHEITAARILREVEKKL